MPAPPNSSAYIMKKILTRLLLPVLLATASVSLLGQATKVEIYLKPDIASKNLGRISLDDPRMGQATPVLDEAKAALGWHFADYSGKVDGYVPDAKIGKDLFPVDNALIHAGPSAEATVLGTYHHGNTVEIVDTGEWWHIRYAGNVPVYFVLDTPPPLPPVTAVAETPPTAPATASQLPSPPPGGMELQEPVITDHSAIPATGSGIVLQEPTTITRPGVVGQRYEGTFRKSRRFLGLIAPKAPYYLEALDGNRIAWVDTKDIVIPGSIKDFLDEKVIIHGERTLDQSSKDWTIHARNMRLK